MFMSQMTDKEVGKIFDRIDVNKNGSIDYSEFIAASLDRGKMLSKDRLRKVFNIFDKVRINIYSISYLVTPDTLSYLGWFW